MKNIILAGVVSIMVFCGFEAYARPCEKCHGVCCLSEDGFTLKGYGVGAELGVSRLFDKTTNGHWGQCSEEEMGSGFTDRKDCKGHPLEGRICDELCVLEVNEN